MTHARQKISKYDALPHKNCKVTHLPFKYYMLFILHDIFDSYEHYAVNI